jgi:hypothetical protein
MGSCADAASRSGLAVSRSELVRALATTIIYESLWWCRENVAKYVLWPMLERHLKAGKPDIRLGNLVIWVAAPGDGFDAGRQRLFRYMRELASAAPWLEVVRGVVTDGTCAEYYVLRGGDPEQKAGGDLGEVLPEALADLCADKVPVVAPEDVAAIFGI